MSENFIRFLAGFVMVIAGTAVAKLLRRCSADAERGFEMHVGVAILVSSLVRAAVLWLGGLTP